jgi:hypothetical protein
LFFTTFEDRAAEKPMMNLLQLAEVGVGKTYQSNFFPGDKTLFIDMEAGGLSLSRKWTGTLVDIRKVAQGMGLHPWILCQMIACVVSGPNPQADDSDPYSDANYNRYLGLLKPLGIDASTFDRFEYVIWDSVSVASRAAFNFYKHLPQNIAASGNVDTRAAYGDLGTALTDWYTVIQHTKGKSTIVNAILEKGTDELNRPTWGIQIVGGGGKRSLPGIFDHVIAQVFIQHPESGQTDRAFLCQTPNPMGIPNLKSRGADKQFDVVEQFGRPNLYELTQKLATD